MISFKKLTTQEMMDKGIKKYFYINSSTVQGVSLVVAVFAIAAGIFSIISNSPGIIAFFVR